MSKALRRLPRSAGALFLWDAATAQVTSSELQADAAYVVLAHGASHPRLQVRAVPAAGWAVKTFHSFYSMRRVCHDMWKESSAMLGA